MLGQLLLFERRMKNTDLDLFDLNYQSIDSILNQDYYNHKRQNTIKSYTDKTMKNKHNHIHRA